MNKLLVLFVLAVMFTPSLGAIWSNCGTASDEFQIKSVDILPDPPKKGANLTVAVAGTFTKAVQSGTIALTVKYSIVTLLNTNEPLCGDLTTISCPIPAGPWSKTITELIPGDSPSGSYTGKAVITDQDKKEVACITFSLKL